jgi:hypothetical protein
MSRQGGLGFKACPERANVKPGTQIGEGNSGTVSIGAILI